MRRTVHPRITLGIIAVMALVLPSLPATAAPPSGVIVLDGATSAEGMAAGEGFTFYAGDLWLGDIYRGDIRDGTAELFIDVSDFAPDPRMTAGMKADVRKDLLFVAGGFSGRAYVYNTETAQPVADVLLTSAEGALINDVTLTKEGAWFTNSAAPELYFIPVGRKGQLGAVQTWTLSGPAADITGDFNLNGIASVKGGRTLIVAHTDKGELYTLDPSTGERELGSALIEDVSVNGVDGIIVRGGQLWAVQNFSNQISRIELSDDLSSGEVEEIITSKDFNGPATAALFGNTLAAVNSQFLDPGDTTFEVVLVAARG